MRAVALAGCPTVMPDPKPAEFEAVLERRRRLGQQLAELLGPLLAANSEHGGADRSRLIELGCGELRLRGRVH